MITEIAGIIRAVLSGVVSILFAVSAIILTPLDPSGRAFQWNARTWARVVLAICGIRVRVIGLERLDTSRPHVYVSNHASLLDIPAILASIPDQIRIVYKKELERIPFFGWGLKWGPYIGIDRGSGSESARSLEAAADRIRNGASVLLYAEGTRTQDGRLQPFKRGAFNLAVRAGVPVIPLTINGSFGILRKHSLSVRPGTIELVLESPLSLEGMQGKEAERLLMERVHASIAKHYRDQWVV